MENNNVYKKVYDFTNENVGCLKYIYNLEKSKVLSVVGSGDQYFSSMLNGAKQVDLFDINPTAYLYFLLKFYSIRELTYEEFYDFLILKKFDNLNVQKKLISVLPLDVLKYYKHLVKFHPKTKFFKKDGIKLLSRKNQKYYFNNNYFVIPYFNIENYYKLQEILKQTNIPKFYECNAINLKGMINQKYDILLMSNIYNHIPLNIFQYTKFLKEFDIPDIQASYDWFGLDLEDFFLQEYKIDKVQPGAPYEYNKKYNYVYSLKK